MSAGALTMNAERPSSRTNNAAGAPLADYPASFHSHAGILCALIVPAACDTINSKGAQTFREPTT